MPRRPNSGLPPAPTRAAAVVFALLVLATVAAFAYAQRVKRDPLVLDRFVPGTKIDHTFTPDGDCRHDKIRIRFRTTVSDQGTVQIIKPSGRVVYTLARDEFLKRYRFHTWYWDGRQRGGGTAPAGRYKVRVKLLGEGRTLVPPGAIKLHRAKGGRRSACAGGTGGLGGPVEGAP